MAYDDTFENRSFEFRTTVKACYTVSSVYVEGQSLLYFCHAPEKWGYGPYGTPTPKSGGTRTPPPKVTPTKKSAAIVNVQNFIK